MTGLTGKELDSEEDEEDDAGQEYLKQLAKQVTRWRNKYYLEMNRIENAEISWCLG